MSEEDYKLMEVLIIERKPHRNGPQWKFAGNLTKSLQLWTFAYIRLLDKPYEN